MDVTVIWAAIIALGVFTYVVLDGFHLGIGIVFPFFPDEHERDLMTNTVAPVRTGDASWLVPGGAARYYMTSPEGEKSSAWFQFVEVSPTESIVLDDGFGDVPGEVPPGMPPAMRMTARLDEAYGGTRMTITTTFPSLEAMEQVLGMGMQEGMALALSQADAILAEG